MARALDLGTVSAPAVHLGAYGGHAVYRAICALASRCDHARSTDSVGFSRYDAEMGNNFAELIEKRGGLFTEKQFNAAKVLCHKYRRQLQEMHISLEDIATASFPGAPHRVEEQPITLLGVVRSVSVKDGRMTAVRMHVSMRDDRGVTAWWPLSQLTLEDGSWEEGNTVKFTAPAWLCRAKAA